MLRAFSVNMSVIVTNYKNASMPTYVQIISYRTEGRPTINWERMVIAASARRYVPFLDWLTTHIPLRGHSGSLNYCCNGALYHIEWRQVPGFYIRADIVREE